MHTSVIDLKKEIKKGPMKGRDAKRHRITIYKKKNNLPSECQDIDLESTLFKVSEVLGIPKTLDLQEIYHTLCAMGKLKEHEVVAFEQLATKIKSLNPKAYRL